MQGIVWKCYVTSPNSARVHTSYVCAPKAHYVHQGVNVQAASQPGKQPSKHNFLLFLPTKLLKLAKEILSNMWKNNFAKEKRNANEF